MMESGEIMEIEMEDAFFFDSSSPSFNQSTSINNNNNQSASINGILHQLSNERTPHVQQMVVTNYLFSTEEMRYHQMNRIDNRSLIHRFQRRSVGDVLRKVIHDCPESQSKEIGKDRINRLYDKKPELL